MVWVRHPHSCWEACQSVKVKVSKLRIEIRYGQENCLQCSGNQPEGIPRPSRRMARDKIFAKEQVFRLSFLNFVDKFSCCNITHQREAEPLLAQIFDGCSYMIYFIVNKQETVMCFATAVCDFKTELSMAIPCSVNA